MKRRTELSESLQRKLNAYALAASAAGVGVLALAQPAEAEIIYTPYTPQSIAGHYCYSIDLDHDGRNEFSICYTTWNSGGDSNHSNVIVSGYYVVVGNGGYARALRSGALIGSSRALKVRCPMADVAHPGSAFKGPWANHGKGVRNRYLGFKFLANDGEIHYGWARLSVMVQRHHYPRFLPVLTGYAYESIPNKPIKAGQTKEVVDDPINDDPVPGASLTDPIPAPVPASLGALAIGAPGMSIWRRKE